MWRARRLCSDHFRMHKRECDRGEWKAITEIMHDGKCLWQRMRPCTCCEYDGPLGVEEVTGHYAAINSGQYEHDLEAAAEARCLLEAVDLKETGGEHFEDHEIPNSI